MIKTTYVSALEEGMEVETDVFLLVEKRTGITRKGQPYQALVVGDRTGRIPVRYWNVPKGIPGCLKEGEGVLIRGTVTSWQGTLQLTAKAVAPCPAEPLEELVGENVYPVDWRGVRGWPSRSRVGQSAHQLEDWTSMPCATSRKMCLPLWPGTSSRLDRLA